MKYVRVIKKCSCCIKCGSSLFAKCCMNGKKADKNIEKFLEEKSEEIEWDIK